MIPDFDENGNLPPVGIIRPTIQEFEDRFANKEKSRKELYAKYRNYCDRLISLKVVSIQWINGSYTTIKPRPSDIDIVIHFDGLKLHSNKILQKEFKDLTDKAKMKTNYRCHPQLILIYPKYIIDLYRLYLHEYNHWLKWFSRDKKGNAKGILEFDINNEDFKSESADSGVIDHGK